MTPDETLPSSRAEPESFMCMIGELLQRPETKAFFFRSARIDALRLSILFFHLAFYSISAACRKIVSLTLEGIGPSIFAPSDGVPVDGTPTT